MEFFAAHQWAKKVMSVIPGLVDFAIGLMNFVLNLPDRQGIGGGGVRVRVRVRVRGERFKLSKNCSQSSMLAKTCP